MYFWIVLWQEAYCRLIYLLEVHIIKSEDLELNSTVFLWPEKIVHVFELCDEVALLHTLSTVFLACFKGDLILNSYSISQVMQKAKQKGEKELLAKREGLMVQLEKLGRRIEEFPQCSELDMIQQV